MFLNREIVIPPGQAPSVSSEETDFEVASSSGNILGLETTQKLLFMILDETSKSFPKFNITGGSLLIKFNSPDEEQ